MALSTEVNQFIKEYVKDLSENSAAIFAGAGLSKAAGYVDWPGLLTEIATDLDLRIDKEHDLISLAQYHENHRGNRSGLIRKILEEFSSAGESTENHKILARLPIRNYWTTNYDSLIEDSLKNSYKVVDTKHTESQLSNIIPKRDAVVYKMHGDVTSASDAIITKQQYENYYKTHPGFINTLISDLISKTFLFIGFSFTDPNLDYVLSRLYVHTGNNPKHHYCLIKKETKQPDEDDEIFNYRKRKQNLRINDLKRYNISALLIDDYSDITEILIKIENTFRKKTIFISGSAEEYGEWNRPSAQEFIHTLSKELIKSQLSIVNGFGWGVGSAVINGALEAVYERPDKYSESQLIIKPFPQFKTADKSLPELWEEYRQRMIKLSGIAIFLFGNKKDESNNVINAQGVKREFEIAASLGLIIIPIPTTGFSSKEIYDQVTKEGEKYYKDMLWMLDDLKALFDASMDPNKIIEIVLKIINKLNK